MRLHRYLVLLMLIFGAAYGQLLQPEIGGNDNSHDQKTGETIFRGNAWAVVGDTEILADELRYLRSQGVLIAKGSVVMTTATQRLLAERITYKIQQGTYTIENLRVGQPPLFLSARHAVGQPGHLRLSDAAATWSEPGPWTPTLTAREIDYDFMGRGRFHARDARLGLGSAVPVKLPHFDYDLESPLHSSASLRGGYRGELGAFIGSGLRWPVASGWRVGGDLDVYSARGFLVGPGAGYSLGNPETSHASGGFQSGFINDHGDRDYDILGRPVPERRGFVAWNHRQQLNEQVRVDATVNYWRDSEVLRDFRRDQFVRVQTPDTALEATYTESWHAITLLSRLQPNRFHSVQERLPEIRWDLFPSRLPLDWFGKGSASIAFLREDPVVSGTATDPLKSDRFDVYYGLSKNFSSVPWLGVTPVIGGRLTHYRRPLAASGMDDYTRSLGELGFDAHVLASGVFEYRNDLWQIDGLRHLVKPFLGYRLIPEADKGRRYIPRIDRAVFLPHLAELGLGDTLHIDDLQRSHLMRVGLENRLQTRDTTYGSRDLARLTIANDFRFSREPGQHAVAPTSIEASVAPSGWLEAAVYQTVETRDMTWQQTGASLTIRDADVWAMRFSAHHRKSEISEYAAEYARRLNETFSAIGRWRYDARRGRWYEQSYDLGHNVGNAWFLRYGVTFYDGPRRESSFQFHIDVETRSF